MSTFRRRITFPIYSNINKSNNNNESNLIDVNNYESTNINKNNPLVVVEIDLIKEYITLYNQSNQPVHLYGYSITDEHKSHIYNFSIDCWIYSYSYLYVYTAPGKQLDRKLFKQPYILWTNKDGSLRKKEILNNDHDSIYLYDSLGNCVSYCIATNRSTSHTSNFITEIQAHIIRPDGSTVIYSKQDLTNANNAITSNNIWLIRLSVVRLILVITMYTIVDTNPHIFIVFYWISSLFDIIIREIDSNSIQLIRKSDKHVLIDAVSDISMSIVLNKCSIYYLLNQIHSRIRVVITALVTLLEISSFIVINYNFNNDSNNVFTISNYLRTARMTIFLIESLMALISVSSDYFQLIVYSSINHVSNSKYIPGSFLGLSIHFIVIGFTTICFLLRKFSLIRRGIINIINIDLISR